MEKGHVFSQSKMRKGSLSVSVLKDKSKEVTLEVKLDGLAPQRYSIPRKDWDRLIADGAEASKPKAAPKAKPKAKAAPAKEAPKAEPKK